MCMCITAQSGPVILVILCHSHWSSQGGMNVVVVCLKKNLNAPRPSELFLTFSALVANPKKTTLHGGQSRSWSAEQGKKKKKSGSAPSLPPPARAARSEKKIREKDNSGYTHPFFRQSGGW